MCRRPTRKGVTAAAVAATAAADPATTAAPLSPPPSPPSLCSTRTSAAAYAIATSGGNRLISVSEPSSPNLPVTTDCRAGLDRWQCLESGNEPVLPRLERRLSSTKRCNTCRRIVYLTGIRCRHCGFFAHESCLDACGHLCPIAAVRRHHQQHQQQQYHHLLQLQGLECRRRQSSPLEPPTAFPFPPAADTLAVSPSSLSVAHASTEVTTSAVAGGADSSGHIVHSGHSGNNSSSEPTSPRSPLRSPTEILRSAFSWIRRPTASVGRSRSLKTVPFSSSSSSSSSTSPSSSASSAPASPTTNNNAAGTFAVGCGSAVVDVLTGNCDKSPTTSRRKGRSATWSTELRNHRLWPAGAPVVDAAARPAAAIGAASGAGSGGNPVSEWCIPSAEIRYDRLLWRGNERAVYEGRWHGSVLIHTFRRSQDLWNEVNRLIQVRHENCSLFLGACIERHHLAIVMSPNGGPLLADGQRHLNIEDRLAVVRHVANGMGYLHARNIVHGRLTSRSVVLEKRRAKICLLDQGPVTAAVAHGERGVAAPARPASGQPVMSAVAVGTDVAGRPSTASYWAPELRRSHHTAAEAANSSPPGAPTKAGDVYAFGSLLFEVFTGRQPPAAAAQDQVFDEGWGVCVGATALPPPIRELIAACWSRQPAQRPTFKQLSARLGDDRLLSLTTLVHGHRHSSSTPTRLDLAGLGP